MADDNVVFVCLVVVEVRVETERTEGAVVMGEGSDKVVSHSVPGVRSWQAQIFVLIQLKHGFSGAAKYNATCIQQDGYMSCHFRGKEHQVNLRMKGDMSFS